MTLLEKLLWFPWSICIALLLISEITHSKNIGLWGDVMLSVSFGLSASVFFDTGHTWIGAAFAFPAIRQAYVLTKYFSKTHRER